MKCDLNCLQCKLPDCIENIKVTPKPKKDRSAYQRDYYQKHKYELKKRRIEKALSGKAQKMICQCCGLEINGNWLKYKGKYFCRKDNDSCFKEWLYDRTDGDCEYGTVLEGEEIQISPSWSEEYLNTLGLSKKDF